MPRVTARIVVGIALVLIVTASLAGVVATTAALTVELSNDDGCADGTASDVRATPAPEPVTDCPDEGAGDPVSSPDRPPG